MNKQNLTQNHLKTIFDYKDGELIWKVSTNRKIKIGDIAGYIDAGNYKNTKVCGKQHKNHRLIFLYHHGYFPKHDKLDYVAMMYGVINKKQHDRYYVCKNVSIQYILDGQVNN